MMFVMAVLIPCERRERLGMAPKPPQSAAPHSHLVHPLLAKGGQREALYLAFLQCGEQWSEPVALQPLQCFAPLVQVALLRTTAQLVQYQAIFARVRSGGKPPWRFPEALRSVCR